MKMKKILFILVLMFAVSASASNRISELSSKGESKFHPPKLTAVTLSNGIKCYILEDRDLPVIQATLTVRGGTAYEGKKEAGVGFVMADMLENGGTVSHPPAELDKLLDELAVGASMSIASEAIVARMNGLSKNTEDSLGVFFEMLFEPRFDEERLEIVKKQVIESIRRQDENAGAIAMREYRKLLYGKKSPWGRTIKSSQIKRIKREDVEEFYKKFFYTDRMILALAGDFDKGKMVKMLERLTKKYPRSSAELDPYPGVDHKDKAAKKRISKKFTQAAISVGHFGSYRSNPDVYPLIVMNYVLGGSGSFTSRLKESIRVKRGLAYEAWSMLSFGPDGVPGAFQVHTKTKMKSAKEVINIIKKEIEGMATGNVTEEEFRRAKAGLINSLVFQYETPYDIVSSVAEYVYFGWPEDYIEVYKREMEAVTLDAVNRVAKEYLHPDKLKIVVVGK